MPPGITLSLLFTKSIWLINSNNRLDNPGIKLRSFLITELSSRTAC
jgi:hypothetical protein